MARCANRCGVTHKQSTQQHETGQPWICIHIWNRLRSKVLNQKYIALRSYQLYNQIMRNVSVFQCRKCERNNIDNSKEKIQKELNCFGGSCESFLISLVVEISIPLSSLLSFLQIYYIHHAYKNTYKIFYNVFATNAILKINTILLLSWTVWHINILERRFGHREKEEENARTFHVFPLLIWSILTKILTKETAVYLQQL